MLELCLSSRPIPPRRAAKNCWFSSLGLTLGAAVRLVRLRSETARSNLSPGSRDKTFRMSNPTESARNSYRMNTCKMMSLSPLESALAENRGGAPSVAIPYLVARALSTRLESYSCTKNKSNYLRMIFLQKKVGGTPTLK